MVNKFALSCLINWLLDWLVCMVTGLPLAGRLVCWSLHRTVGY